MINNLLQIAIGAFELGDAERAKKSIREISLLIAANTEPAKIESEKDLGV
jgi:hypothetical protein